MTDDTGCALGDARHYALGSCVVGEPAPAGRDHRARAPAERDHRELRGAQRGLLLPCAREPARSRAASGAGRPSQPRHPRSEVPCRFPRCRAFTARRTAHPAIAATTTARPHRMPCRGRPIDLGNLTGIWADVFARQDALYAKHQRKARTAWRKAVAGLDLAALVAAFRREALMIDGPPRPAPTTSHRRPRGTTRPSSATWPGRWPPGSSWASTTSRTTRACSQPSPERSPRQRARGPPRRSPSARQEPGTAGSRGTRPRDGR